MIDKLDLTTPRLRIRHFREADSDDCYRFRRDVFGAREAPEAAERWLGWTIASYRELAQLKQPPYADYALERRDDGVFVGAVGIVPTLTPWGALNGDAADALLSPEVGLFWGILPGYRRRGYASEAAAALCDFLFERLRLRQVIATTAFDNAASQRVMQKLGMTLRRNPLPEPAWCQIVGKLRNPR